MLNKPDLTFNMKLDFISYLRQWIDIQLTSESSYDADDDKIILAALVEIRRKLSIKLANNYKGEYRIKLSACQAIAMRMLYTSFDIGSDNYFTNELRKISDRVHQHYAA